MPTSHNTARTQHEDRKRAIQLNCNKKYVSKSEIPKTLRAKKLDCVSIERMLASRIKLAVYFLSTTYKNFEKL